LESSEPQPTTTVGVNTSEIFGAIQGANRRGNIGTNDVTNACPHHGGNTITPQGGIVTSSLPPFLGD